MTSHPTPNAERPAVGAALFQRGHFFLRLLVAFACLLFGPHARAHRTSDSYLTLTVEHGAVTGKWDIGLRDLVPVVGMKLDPNAVLNEAEMRTCLERAAGYAMPRLRVLGDGRGATLRVTDTQIEHHTDGVFAVLKFAVEEIGNFKQIEVQYHLFFDEDPLHCGFMLIEEGEKTHTAIFNAGNQTRAFTLATTSAGAAFGMFFREGTGHIWSGHDHVLFLLALLLPAVLRREAAQWLGAERFRPAAVNVVKIVTAFTVAHSITLTLAAIGVVVLPSRLVESSIAASVMLAAANNVRPFFRGREWMVTFAFGLVHGLGFASALGELGLRRENLWQTLAAFNLGVEAGQLVIVAVFLPVAFALRNTALYRRFVLVGGSVLIFLVALAWLIERAFEVKIFPG